MDESYDLEDTASEKGMLWTLLDCLWTIHT